MKASVKNFNMEEVIKFFLISCIILYIAVEIYFEIIKENTPILLNYVFVILFYLVIFEIITGSIQYILSFNNAITKNSNLKFDVNVLIYNIALIIFILMTVCKYQYGYDYLQKFNVISCTMCVIISYVLSKAAHLDEIRQENTLNINSMQGLDYGSAMAYSYYYGYLRIILPSTGSLNKGLVEKLENIEDNHNIKISVHKLFILIPSSSYIPPDLKEASYQWMEGAMNLEEEERNRAGIKRRTYHNTVYKIYPNGQRFKTTPLYVVVEGATPLLTFYEVQKYAHNETNVYKKYGKEIILKFYEKLKELISNDAECADLCELIYYNDCNNNGTKVNVAKIILSRLSQIWNVNSENFNNVTNIKL